MRRARHIAPPTRQEPLMNDTASSAARETAVLGGGCFWCLEAVFDELDGVVSVESGYAGGARENPSYDEVCSGRTGHAEVVRVTFDPQVLSFRDLLTVFFSIHDPTTPDRQGNDVGTQYRSVDLLRERRAAGDRRGRRARAPAGEALARSDRHRDRREGALLSGRGLPPGVFRAQRPAAVLPGGGCAEGGQVPQELRRAPEGPPGHLTARSR